MLCEVRVLKSASNPYFFILIPFFCKGKTAAGITTVKLKQLSCRVSVDFRIELTFDVSRSTYILRD